MFDFGSFRSRLIFFLLCLLIPVLGGIFYYVNSNNTEYTEETINRYLELGADVFDYTRAQQAETLQAITNSLTWDFGFRTAYASRDPATLFDASLNVLDRSLDSADMLMIVDLNLSVVIDTELQGYDELPTQWLALLETAEESDDGLAEAIVTIDDEPFQLIALPLYLPRQVAWIIGGFALDEDFVYRVAETVVSDVSILRKTESGVEVVASNLAENRRAILANELQVNEGNLNLLQQVSYGEEVFTSLLRRLYVSDSGELEIFAVIQRSYDENNVNVVQFRQLLIQFYGIVIVLSLLAVIWLARSIANPLVQLAGAVRKIEQGEYSMHVELRSKDEIGDLAASVNAMADGLSEKEKVRDLLGKVVSPQIADQLLSNPIELGGEEKVVTILFSDIKGFTTYCEGLRPQKVLEELNRVLSRISNIVEKHSGVVDKYQGDAVMALFGAPVTGEKDPSNAIEAALEIIEALEEVDSRLSACVGLNTGLVVAGNLGSNNRLNYSVIGDTVNLAARLESLTRLYNVSNIVSEATKTSAEGYCYLELDSVCVAGKSQPVTIYEVQGREGCLTATRLSNNEKYTKALLAYRNQDWDSANQLFSELSTTCDNSHLHKVFLERIENFKVSPPPNDWDGVFVFGSK